MRIGRRALLIGAALSAVTGGVAAADESDLPLGAPNARVTLLEYASLTCPHCAQFHAQVWEQLKARYIDSGRIKFVLREFPTAPASVAVAGFQIARCGNADAATYYQRVSVLFAEQRNILANGTMAGVRDNLLRIGAGFGLTPQQIMECVTDPAGAARVMRVAEAGRTRYQIDHTPTLVLNERVLTHDEMTFDGLSRAIDSALAGG